MARGREEGIVVVLVAVVLLFIIAAMAALAIDLVTFYTARSEAQLAADGAALAGARVLANSGMTSNPSDTTLTSNAENLALTVATQVASNNLIEGAAPDVVAVSFPPSNLGNPHVTVHVQRTALPTFFAHIWGRATVTVGASATAEAYNPSGSIGASVSPGPSIAPTCVKPWLLPNLDPTGLNPAAPIFLTATGNINNTALVGRSWPAGNGLAARCLDCSGPGGIKNPPTAGLYYPGAIDADDFPVPTQGLPAGSASFNAYQLAVAGCVPKPIQCGATPTVQIDTTAYTPATADRNTDTVQAVSNLIHYNGAAGDSDNIETSAALPSPPFQFLAGNANPAANAVGKDVFVSDSLVTVPVFDSSAGAPPSGTVTIIGFLQLFLNPQSAVLLPDQIPATIINMAGCGIAPPGQPILGNGGSPVTVRLITPPPLP